MSKKSRKVITVEQLEIRQFLSASLTDSGVLIVTGGADTPNSITVGLSGDGTSVDVTINGGAVQAFDATAVKRLVVIGGEADDVITIDESSHPLSIPAKIFGGGGDDSIVGGSGPEFISGGAGNDTIDAGSGNTTVTGGGGNDSITGGSGTDMMYGNGGADSLIGGSGSGDLAGGQGNDILRGGSGHDTLSGGGGHNRLNGGAGDNIFVSTSDNDNVIVGTGQDTLSGNTDGDHIKNAHGGMLMNGGIMPPVIPGAPSISAPMDTPADTSVGTVTGTVVDSSGNAVSNATVLLCTATDDAVGFTTAGSFSASTDANGDFSLTDIPAGQYVAVAGEKGVGFVHTTITVTDGQTTTVDLALAPFANPGDGTGAIGGMVTDGSGNPVTGASVLLVLESGSGEFESDASLKATTDQNGAYSLANVPIGTYAVVVVEPNVGYADLQATVTSGQTTTLNATISSTAPPTINGGTVAGTIVDSNSNAVAGASLCLTDTTSGAVFGGSTDANGDFSVNVPAGTYTFLAGEHGVGRVEVSDVVVTSGQTTTEDVMLVSTNPQPTPPPAQDGTVTGTITDANGNPVADASVGLFSDGPGIYAQTDGNGNYTLSAPAGTYNESAGEDGVGVVNMSGVVVTTGQTTTENLQLQPRTTPTPAQVGTVSGVVSDSQGNPAADVSVVLYANNTEVSGTTDDQGNFSLQAPAGTYTLRARVSADVLTYQSGVVVTAGQTTTQNLQLPAPPAPVVNGTVSGQVTDPNGNPLANASVGLFEDGRQITGQTDSNGNYSLSAPAGTYILRAGLAGVGLNYVSDVVVTSGQTTTENVQLVAQNNPVATGTVLGVLTDSQGNVAANVSVVLFSDNAEFSGTTDANGNFTFQAPAGTYTLRARESSAILVYQSNVVVTAGQTTTQNLQLPAPPAPVVDGTVSGEITDPNGNPVADCSVGVFVNGVVFGAETDANGDYTIQAPAGTYEIGAGLANVGSKYVPGVVVTSGQTTMENLMLNPPSQD